MATTDEILVQRAARGEEIAFSELVTRYYRRVVRVAYGLLKQQEDAEDIVQIAFARVHRRLADFQGQSAFYTWLYRVVVNASIDLLRKRRREKRTSVADDRAKDAHGLGAELWPVFPGHDPAAVHRRRELNQQLNTALARLSTIHRAVIVLREVEGQSYEQIAATLDIKRGTVMSRLFNARRALQGTLNRADGAAASSVRSMSGTGT